MTRDNLIQLLMPDFMKRRKIKSLVSEYNIRTRLRNEAYDLTTPQPEIIFTASDQAGESLDRTIEFLQKNISMMSLDNYSSIIEENKAKRQAKKERQLEEREKFITM